MTYGVFDYMTYNMAEGVNHVTKCAIRHGSRLTCCLHNPQNLGICRTKILCEVHQTLFSRPNTKEKKRSGHARLLATYMCNLCIAYTKIPYLGSYVLVVTSCGVIFCSKSSYINFYEAEPIIRILDVDSIYSNKLVTPIKVASIFDAVSEQYLRSDNIKYNDLSISVHTMHMMIAR